jgi:adenylate kinase family enzyme
MIKNADKSNGFLIDGYPREVPQAKKFEELVSQEFFFFEGWNIISFILFRLLHVILFYMLKRVMIQ